MGSREAEGLKHIHNLMHVLIEGIAAGVYISIDDAQRDAQEYLTMEKAIKKLSNWNESSSIEELANIFDLSILDTVFLLILDISNAVFADFFIISSL